jgi:hypothetical protein
MKTYLTIKASIVAAAAFSLAISALAANRLVIVASRGLPPEVTRPILFRIGEHLLNEAEPGVLVSIFDPVTQSVPVEFTVPEGSPNARARNKDFKPHPPEIKRAFDRAAEEDWQKCAVRLPETLRYIRTKIAAPGDKVTVLAVGSPAYKSGEFAYDFASGAVPSDGWLRADADDLRFSIEKPGTLKGWRVFLAPVPNGWSENNDWFAAEVERFYAAFIQLQGGRFMLADFTVALPKLGKGEVPEVGFRPIKPEDRELIFRKRTTERGHEREASAKTNNVDVATERPPTRPVVQARPVAAPLTVAVLTQIPRVAAGEMGIGMAWENAAQQTNCDMDLRITVKGVPGELSYGALRLMQGAALVASLKKDIVVAPGIAAQGDPRSVYEFATIHREVQPEDVTLYLNVFQNRSRSPISVALLVEYNQHRWTKLIQIPATAGDGGSSRDRNNSVDWVRVDLAGLIAGPCAVASQ